MGLGAFPASDPAWLGMVGMHGAFEANHAMHDCDVMICLGARFDDRVTGRLDAFSPGSKKIHVDIDPSSINKNVRVEVPIIGDAGAVIERMIKMWKDSGFGIQDSGKKSYCLNPESRILNPLEDWWKKIEGWRARKSFS